MWLGWWCMSPIRDSAIHILERPYLAVIPCVLRRKVGKNISDAKGVDAGQLTSNRYLNGSGHAVFTWSRPIW
jgi:hypothetical protein